MRLPERHTYIRCADLIVITFTPRLPRPAETPSPTQHEKSTSSLEAGGPSAQAWHNYSAACGPGKCPPARSQSAASYSAN